MKRILLLYYSQTGDASEIARTFIGPLADMSGVEIATQSIEPIQPFPFPWGSLRRLLSVFPECQIGQGCTVQPLAIDHTRPFDLVVLAYQVWHLAPSLPVQGFLKSPDAAILDGKRVVTLCVCRSMWHAGSETMKRLLHEAGAVHLDNVVVSHQGPVFATFVSVPRLLLFGKRDRAWGIFPPAGVSQADLDRVRRLGSVVAERLKQAPNDWPRESLLRGVGAVQVKRRYVIPELIGLAICRFWARLVLWAGRFGSVPRRLAEYGYMAMLLSMVLCGMPVTLLLLLLASPFTHRWVECRAAVLAAPSGEGNDQLRG